MIRKVSFVLTLALLPSFLSAGAQQNKPKTKLQKQLDRIDLGINVDGIFNGSMVSGSVQPKGGAAPDQGLTVTDKASNTVGEYVDLRYIARPYVGFEFNFVNARYTENFVYPVATSTIVAGQPVYASTPFGVQTGAREFTLGYMVTPHTTLLGLQPFVSLGGGGTEFTPTAHGGEGLPKQVRATYYYNLGVQGDLNHTFGLRLGFRETFFLAPDFGQNYLTILQHTSSYEPYAGFYLHF